MEEYITCLEQNDESPFGFKERATYMNDTWCIKNNVTDLCALYGDISFPRPDEGDVCDHTDPDTGIIRNACKMEITFGANETETKTWSWKCVELSTCELKDDDGVAIPGCYITSKRINCCCNDRDYCQDDPVYIAYAAFGRADHFPINFTALLAIDPGDNYVVLDPSVPGYDSWQYGPQKNATTIDVAACEVIPNDRLLDVLILVDGSCPMDVNECEQQQIDIADTMASLRGIETYNVEGATSIFAQVKIGYIEFPTGGGKTGVSRLIFDLNDDLNVDINDAEQARIDIYDKIKDSDTMCIDPEQRTGNPTLVNAVTTAFDIFDGIDDEGNSTSDKVILIISNCGATQDARGVNLCDLYEERKREDVKVIMINNKPDINDSMSDPESYMSCLVDDDINRILVVNDGDNYMDIIPQIQSQVCTENITNITSAPQTSSVPLTTQETTTSNVTAFVSTLNPTTSNPTTSNPTQNPTQNPTSNPSQSPITPGDPTVAPTNPTISPSKTPTNNPTPSPSVNPSSSPTNPPTLTSTENLITTSTDHPSTAPTAKIIESGSESPTKSPIETTSESIECDKEWMIAFKGKLSEYEISDNWETNLKSSFLEAFKQSIISIQHLNEWESDWCVDIEMWFNLEISNKRMLLQTNDIEVEGSFIYNNKLNDEYFDDNYDSIQFNDEYHDNLAQVLDINKDDIQELHLESPSHLSSSSGEIDFLFIIIIGILIVIIFIIVVILCIMRMRKDSSNESSIHRYRPTHDVDDETATEDDEERVLV